MYHDFTYRNVLASSIRAQWNLDDVLPEDAELDFSRNFMPDSLARTAKLPGLTDDERRTLNQIVAHQYLHLFGLVEEFILPFVLDHARPMLDQDDYRVRALINFANEEAKHIHLFRRFHDTFVRGFPVPCRMVEPREQFGQMVLSRHPLAIGLITLMIEWMTQAHYLGSIRNAGDIDPLFKSLLKHHWMEEAQHAKLDTLIVDALAEGRTEAELDAITEEFFAITRYLDQALHLQAKLNIATLEHAIGRTIDYRPQIIGQQHQAARWTYIVLGLTHERFRATLQSISPKMAARVARATPPGIQATNAATAAPPAA